MCTHLITHKQITTPFGKDPPQNKNEKISADNVDFDGSFNGK